MSESRREEVVRIEEFKYADHVFRYAIVRDGDLLRIVRLDDEDQEAERTSDPLSIVRMISRLVESVKDEVEWSILKAVLGVRDPREVGSREPEIIVDVREILRRLESRVRR